jgi:hypothetical protein
VVALFSGGARRWRISCYGGMVAWLVCCWVRAVNLVLWGPVGLFLCRYEGHTIAEFEAKAVAESGCTVIMHNSQGGVSVILREPKKGCGQVSRVLYPASLPHHAHPRTRTP